VLPNAPAWLAHTRDGTRRRVSSASRPHRRARIARGECARPEQPSHPSRCADGCCVRPAGDNQSLRPAVVSGRVAGHGRAEGRPRAEGADPVIRKQGLSTIRTTLPKRRRSVWSAIGATSAPVWSTLRPPASSAGPGPLGYALRRAGMFAARDSLATAEARRQGKCHRVQVRREGCFGLTSGP